MSTPTTCGSVSANRRSGGLAFLCSALAAAFVLGATPDSAAAAHARPVRESGQRNTAVSKQQRFFQTYATDAVESMQKTGVPASVTLAQAALESAWGESRLARLANNFFGIKGSGKSGSEGVVWMNTGEVVHGRNVVVREPFRAYGSAAESFTDHGRLFVENRRYARAMAMKDDPKAFAREIARAGYATDPSYARKLVQLMERYNLYRFDAGEPRGGADQAALPVFRESADLGQDFRWISDARRCVSRRRTLESP